MFFEEFLLPQQAIATHKEKHNKKEVEREDEQHCRRTMFSRSISLTYGLTTLPWQVYEYIRLTFTASPQPPQMEIYCWMHWISAVRPLPWCQDASFHPFTDQVRIRAGSILTPGNRELILFCHKNRLFTLKIRLPINSGSKIFGNQPSATPHLLMMPCRWNDRF